MKKTHLRLYASYPVLHLFADSTGEQQLLSKSGLSCDIGEDYFALMGSDAWSTIVDSKHAYGKSFEVRIDNELLFSCPVDEELAAAILLANGVLVVQDNLEVNEENIEDGELDAFLLGTWKEKPF